MRVELRANPDGKKEVKVSGYVNVTGRDSRPIPDREGTFIEQITPGSFGVALRSGKPVRLMFNHKDDLGSTEDGTLTLKEDSIGLYADARTNSEKVIEAATKKELRGWSFGFVSQKDRWKKGENGERRRYIDGMELREVSILDVTPAYIATSIETRGEETNLIEFSDPQEEKPAYTETREKHTENEPGGDTVKAFLESKKAEIENFKRRIKLES